MYPPRRAQILGYLGINALVCSCAQAQRMPATPILGATPNLPAYTFSAFPATPLNTDSIFVVLTFSGGGTRAAALAYGVLRELEATSIDSGRAKRSVLNEVDLISSVSGGSFTAAALAMGGPEGLAQYERDFLKWNAEDALKKKGLRDALRWIHVFGGSYGRSDVAAELWDEHLFHGATFSDLVARHRRPFLFINAEDMAGGVPFTFTNEWLSPMCADLAKLPIARAVAASSAFPGLLDPMTLQNHAGQCGYSPPHWVRVGLLNAIYNPEDYHRATLLMSYTDRARRPFIHLIDGGPADNLGIRPVIRSLSSTGGDPSIQDMIANKVIKQLLVIVVNARTSDASDIDKSPNIPGIIAVLQSAASTPFGNFSEESLERLVTYADDTRRIQLEGRCTDLYLKQLHRPIVPRTPVIVDVAELGFDQLPNPRDRAWFEALPTTFQLPPATVDSVISAGRRLLHDNADFQRAVARMTFHAQPDSTQAQTCLR